MKRLLFCTSTLVLLAMAGCKPADRNPEQIRQETAKATETAARDAKAVAQGVEDGLKSHDGAVNINKAPEADLEKLPGVDARVARRIVAGRPYGSSDDLVKRHLLTKAEYDKISGEVVAE